VQLTDGKLVQGYFWAQQGTVGWHGYDRVAVTIDLGSVQPIAGIGYHTAAGTAGVKLPRMIYLLVSDDDGQFRPVVDFGAAPPVGGNGDATHPVWYRADNLHVRGRYVRLLIAPGAGSDCVFCDEIEVWRDDSGAGTPPEPAPTFASDADFMTSLLAGRRLRADWLEVNGMIRNADIRSNLRRELQQESATVGAQVAGNPFPDVTSGFRAILPFGEIHRAIFRLNARLLATEGYHGLVPWSSHRFAPVGLFQRPPRTKPELSMRLQAGERRGEVVNLTNAGTEDRKVRLQVRNLPGGANPHYLQLYQVEWWDTRLGSTVLDPLVGLAEVGGWFETVVPAGMTRQVWLSISTGGLAAGSYQGRIVLQEAETEQVVPLGLRIDPPVRGLDVEPGLWLWDYTAGAGAYAITTRNRMPAIQALRAYGISMPCATAEVRPAVKATDFDESGALLTQPDFHAFDSWVREWPGASRYYIVFPAVDSFLQFKAGSPAFTRAVAAYARSWAAHNRQLGLRSRQVLLHFVDEPHSDAQYEAFTIWARAVRTGTDELGAFINPSGDTTVWSFPSAASALELADVICPELPGYLHGGEAARRYYAGLQAAGKQVAVYAMFQPGSCDPTAAQRLLPWFGFARGLDGLGLWSYADAPRENVWNDYVQLGRSYSPDMLESATTTPTKHGEALQEGLEDARCLRQLKRVAASVLAGNPRQADAMAARDLLAAVEPDTVGRYLQRGDALADGAAGWARPRDTALPDRVRLRVLELLARLAHRAP